MKKCIAIIGLFIFWISPVMALTPIKMANTCGIANNFLKLQAIDQVHPYSASFEEDQTILDPMIYLYLKDNKNNRVLISIDYSYCLIKGLPYNRCRDDFMRILHTAPITLAELENAKGVIPVTCN